ncbi:myosin heavy chain-like protein [Dorcoceras hygrometricum]|uniref:Myosin heavy chain-like protein n=1 Tax=Dorcoceras hygrometricum TaxID=472368 RepID=A0A2Z7AX79_9LAMI|nr:myosin heavy chain-like protein [Dorcoceras hygrometricum]
MMEKFEVVIPHPDERAHRPPPGFHTFYMNQIEMGLRFPIPRFIAAFCRHISLSSSQLAPNSYSFLLALAVLLSYHGLPLIPYVLMQLVQIKRLGPGKFYLPNKGDHSFIKGNPSSYKGWMSRFFYAKCDMIRDPWKCEMHWRDSAVTLVPRTPDRAPSLTPFLEAMHGKSYSAPELIREDLLCFYKFSRKGVELVGDLGIFVSCLSRVFIFPLCFARTNHCLLQTSEWVKFGRFPSVWQGSTTIPSSELYARLLITFALDDVGRVDA